VNRIEKTLTDAINMGLQGESIESETIKMVTYQYMCDNCHFVTEANFPIGEYPQSIHCSNEPCECMARKIIATPGVFIPNPTHDARKNRGQG